MSFDKFVKEESIVMKIAQDLGLTKSGNYKDFPMINNDNEILFGMILQNSEHN